MAIRITGGVFRGRQVLVPPRIRPTQDKVRSAVFSILGGVVSGARVLDLFAGSGALGLEAASRGAESVCWVEAERRVMSVLKKNVETLCPMCGEEALPVHGLGRMKPGSGRFALIQAEVLRYLKRVRPTLPFGIIFADPPYDAGGLWLKKILSGLSGQLIVEKDGLFIMEQSARAPVATQTGWQLIERKTYGDSQICFFRMG